MTNNSPVSLNALSKDELFAEWETVRAASYSLMLQPDKQDEYEASNKRMLEIAQIAKEKGWI